VKRKAIGKQKDTFASHILWPTDSSETKINKTQKTSKYLTKSGVNTIKKELIIYASGRKKKRSTSKSKNNSL
jgi:hypothetical protein